MFPPVTPDFQFDPDTQSYFMLGPSEQSIAAEMALAFSRDVDDKVRSALIARGWMPPEVVGEFKAAFRANMLRFAPSGEDVNAEIDRIFAVLERAK